MKHPLFGGWTTFFSWSFELTRSTQREHIAYSKVILGRHLLAGESEFSWEIPASRVKHCFAIQAKFCEVLLSECGFLCPAGE
jgi:hypothetical protein